MTVPFADQPYLALVDDDFHSARLMTRMLSAHGAPSIVWMGDAAAASRQLRDLAADRRAHRPGLVIVDLKSSSDATARFIAGVAAAIAPGVCMRLVAMAPSLDRATRAALIEAGAEAVFARHADLELYRTEAAAIVGFWVRNQHLDAVGT